jgi:hypothetical protein
MKDTFLQNLPFFILIFLTSVAKAPFTDHGKVFPASPVVITFGQRNDALKRFSMRKIQVNLPAFPSGALLS